jgi:carbamoyltransferase
VAPAGLADEIAALLAEEKVIGLLQGRMEFGPRALGGRSILADARSTRMQSVLNLKIKFRESFRPFAPSVLREHVADWFELDDESPYMLLVADVTVAALPVSDRRCVRHRAECAPVDGAGNYACGLLRTHPDRREANPLYYDIIAAFHRRTGRPMLVNTSFNAG